MKKFLMILFAVAASYGITSAQKPGVVISDAKGWHKIGTLTADFQRETDEISVFLADRFAAIKFKVEDASINLSSLKVFYEDGTVEDVTGMFPMAIQAPGESKVIDLKGTERELKKVQFTYSTVEGTGVKHDNNATDNNNANRVDNTNTNRDNANRDNVNRDKKAKVELWGLKTNVVNGDKSRDKKTSEMYKDDKRNNKNK
jgi:hypothetical protein